MRNFLRTLLTLSAFSLSSLAFALPALQLGPGGTTDGWVYTYEEGTDEGLGWVCESDCDGVTAYANATKDDDGKGKYAWQTEEEAKYAYLVIAAVGGSDATTVTVTDSDGNITNLTTTMEGAPPAGDDNALAPHGIYDTYYAVYMFEFDGGLEDIYDTQEGEDGTGKGYIEEFDISFTGADGIHFDMYTLSMAYETTLVKSGRGKNATYQEVYTEEEVYTFAPFSHDAEFHEVPEPGSLALLGLGLLGLGLSRRKRKAA